MKREFKINGMEAITVNEEKKRILKLVEEGKITASEALTLLELLEQDREQKSVKEKEILHELSDVVVLDEQEKKDQEKEQTTQQKISSTKDMIFSFVDNLVSKVKEVDLNFTKSIEVTHIFHEADAIPTDVDIEVANGSVEILTWDGPGVKVECEAKVYRTDDQAVARSTLLNETTFYIKNQKLYFIVGHKWMKMNSKIFVPSSQYNKVRIKVLNGAIDLNGLSIHKLNAKTGNGKITLQSVTGKEAKVETVNGNIELWENTVDHLECETINGQITSNGAFQSADFETFNGDIQVENVALKAKNIKAKSGSGAIRLFVPPTLKVSGEAKTYLGALHVELSDMKVTETKNEVIQKVMKFENEEQADLRLFAESKSASVTIKNASSM